MKTINDILDEIKYNQYPQTCEFCKYCDVDSICKQQEFTRRLFYFKADMNGTCINFMEHE